MTKVSSGGSGMCTIWRSAALASFSVPRATTTTSSSTSRERWECANIETTAQIATRTIEKVSKNDQRRGFASDNACTPIDVAASRDESDSPPERLVTSI